ncbi:hypothetical protein BV210_10860 [Halorientalis sp. IM1011]|uniref:methyl-accepting chemotaxis protein n=1 Tax=Halorientalis sp. IM1011 TaxID=1932360 RepID=UPI00097CD157|nr:methyl-accepting chemotaxis protein [Halorientalis sp. IM1011]AQL43186.1 hypothetical protein BV210_10860 [Halorientalis sp. IM1011]
MNTERLVPDRIRSRYSLKIAATLALVFAVTLVSAAFFYGNVAGELGSSADAALAADANESADTAALWVEANADLATSVAATETVESGDADRIGEYLAGAAAGSDRVGAIHYVEDGRIAASSASSAVGQSLSVATSEGTESVAVDEPRDAVVGNGSVIPVVAPAGENGYVVVAGAAETLRNRLADEKYDTALAAGDEVVLAAGDQERAAGATELTANGTATGTVGETDLVAATATVSGTGWHVVSHAPTGTVYGDRNVATAAIVALIYIVALNLGIFGVTVGGNLALALQRLADRAEEIGRGNLDVELSTDRADEVGVLYDEFDSMRRSLEESLDEAEEARTEAERAREEAEQSELRTQRLNEALEAEAERYSEVMAACAEGDLTERLDPEADSEAMQAIATSFNDMIASLEATVADVEEFADDVAESSTGVEESAAEVREASAAVDESVAQISAGAHEQTEDLQATADEVNDLSAAIQEVAATTDEIASESDRVARLGSDGREQAEATIAEMREVEGQIADAVTAIEDLAAEIEQVSEATELIDDIAEQTSILALNANIEAARAGDGGDAGEGFAVVADEVKELAEETKAVVTEIQSQVEAVQERAHESADDIRATESRITDGVASVEELTDALEAIVDGVDEVDTGLKSIARTTDDQADSAEGIVAMVDEVASVSEQTTQQADTVSEAAGEATESIDEVSDAAGRLAERTRELRRMLSTFEVDADERPVDSTVADGGRER